jgi:hypothetical protein
VDLYDSFVWRALTPSAESGWWLATGRVLVQAGVVTAVFALILMTREMAARGALPWLALCVVALLIIAGADSSFTGYTLLQILDSSLVLRMLRSVWAQQIYYGVVSLLLVCAPLAPLLYAIRNGRAGRAPVVAA